MAEPDEPPKVSTFYRVLAWVFVVCCVLAAAAWVSMFVSGKSMPLSRAEAVLGFLGLLLCVPLFFFVAFKGRPPRWWSSIDDMLDIEKALKRHVEKRGKH